MTAGAIVFAALLAHRWDDHMWGRGWMWLWGSSMLVLLVGAIVVVVWLVVRDHRRVPSARTARDILAERYARGEITTEEYRERLHQL